MKILIVGSGGREHALAWRLAQSTDVEEVVVSPGNPGVESVARRVPAAADLSGIADLAAAEGVDFTVVGPEAPLVAGIVDVFRTRGLKIVGPTQAAARLEGSKLFAKEFFGRAGIPTARTSAELSNFHYPVVIKADGLAAGKGVVVAGNRSEAEDAIARLGPDVLLEEFLEGEEVSFIALTDGKRVLPFAPTQDHKRVFDGDRGPNTGGMGAYCDARILSSEQTSNIMEQVMLPAIRQMEADGTPFTGFLYAGLMMTAEGPKILEFNVRLGDPETQVLMKSLHADLAGVLARAAEGHLPDVPLGFGRPSACVVVAAPGYPDRPVTGQTITGVESVAGDAAVFQAGTAWEGGQLKASGGRVLSVAASGDTLQAAIDLAYEETAKIHFEGMHFRRDIGLRGLARW